MKNVPTYIIHEFLNCFNNFDTLIGKYLTVDEYKSHLSRIARFFGIRDKELLDTYFNIFKGDVVRGADCESNFNMLCRAIEFFPDKFSEDVRTVVNHRKGAIDIKKKIAAAGDPDSLEGIIGGIGHLATAGDVGCMALLAYMKLYSIFVKKEVSEAIKLVRNAALWNNTFALILGIKYDNKHKANYYPTLKAAFYAASQEEAYKHLEKYHEISENVGISPVAIALEKRFYNNLSYKDRISQPIIDVINSVVLTEASKVHLIKTSNETPDFSSIPLGITSNSPLTLPKKLQIKRPVGEDQEITAILSNFALHNHKRSIGAEYKPLLIICSDEYTLDTYKQAIVKAIHPDNLVRVDLKCAPVQSFSAVIDNPIVSEMNGAANASVVAIIEGCASLNEASQADLARFLRTSAKGELHHHYNLRFDYSNIVPILMSTGNVCPQLLSECDVVKLSPTKECDKPEIINGLLFDKKQAFSLESITIEDAAIKCLSRLPIATISSVIDRVVSLKAQDGRAFITNADVEPLIPKKGGFEAASFWG